MRLLSHNPIAEGYEHQTYEDAGNDIACKAHDVSSLKHLHALIGKSWEGSEATTHTRREQ